MVVKMDGIEAAEKVEWLDVVTENWMDSEMAAELGDVKVASSVYD